MTPEKLNRTIEFIAQSLARLDQDPDREEYKALDRRLTDLEERLVSLLEAQTRRKNSPTD